MRSRHTRATAGRIGDIGGEASIVTGDLTTEAGMQQAVAHAEARFGRLDIAFNNLGDFAFHTLAVEATSEAQWDYLSHMNLKTAYLLTRIAVPALQRAGREAGADRLHAAHRHGLSFPENPGDLPLPERHGKPVRGNSGRITESTATARRLFRRPGLGSSVLRIR